MQANNGKDIDARVRQRLREFRNAAGLTLQQVAELANIDVSTLSRLETGKRRLALDHIPALAGALGVSTDDLLGPPAPQDLVSGHTPPVRRYDHVALTNRDRCGGPRYRIEIAGRRRCPPTHRPTPTARLGSMSSTADSTLLGDDDLIIEPGEAVEFATTSPHWFGGVDGPVTLIRHLRRRHRSDSAHLEH